MATRLLAGSTGDGIQYTVGDTDSFYVAEGTLIYSTSNYAITALASYQNAVILGQVEGDIAGLWLGDTYTSDHDQSVLVGSTGVLGSSPGYGNGLSLTAYHSLIRNEGHIHGNVGVYTYGAGASLSKLYNSGTISGNFAGVMRGGGEDFYLLNTGTIEGRTYAFRSFDGGGDDVVVNRNLIVGRVDLGDGNDRYDGRAGQIEGEIHGQTGNDTILPGTGPESVFGEDGIDTLDFSSSANGLRVDLSGVLGNTGLAAGDDYSGIERILGSRSGGDTLVGGIADEALLGQGGNDLLVGGAGRDSLTGGNGADVLTGGTGNDVFVFTALSDAVDTISDFHNGAGDNDSLQVSHLIGGGLTVGALAAAKFWATTTNHAHDASDRFIFRTTDATLWFDANGNAAGGPILLADLQAGAVLTAADIIIV